MHAPPTGPQAIDDTAPAFSEVVTTPAPPPVWEAGPHLDATPAAAEVQAQQPLPALAGAAHAAPANPLDGPVPMPGSVAGGGHLQPWDGSQDIAPGKAPGAAVQAALASAAEAGLLGIQGVGRFGGWVLDAAERVDVWLYGWRGRTIMALAFVAAGFGVLEWVTSRPPVLTVLTTFLLLFGLEFLALARLGSLRDEAGAWSLGLALRRLGGASGDALASFGDFLRLAGGLRLQLAGKASIGLGLVSLVVRNVLVALARAATLVGFGAASELERMSGWLLVAGLTGLVGGGMLWLTGWRQLREDARRRDFEVEPASRERISQVSRALPAVIDCADASAIAALANGVGHPLLRETLLALGDWRPRAHRYEDDYQRLLFRHIRRRLPAARPEREKPVLDPVTGKPGRADLVVGDTVLIEMKTDLSAGSVHRAVTQVAQYARSWSHGPILLLICGADVDTVRRKLGYELEELHRRGPVSLVVAAGSRR